MLAKRINKGHEVTNPRVIKNLEVLDLIKDGATFDDCDYQTFGAIKFLNRKGLLKYKKRKEDTNKIVVYPTLLFYYLTLVLKYDTYTVYSESIKLYEKVGDKLNHVKYI